MTTTVADRLARLLREAGIREIYGLPGGENLALLDTMRSNGLRFVLAHHETSAIFMADATARLRRRPSACLTTLGPGAANAVPGITHAFLDRSPVLLITAQNSAPWSGTHSHQRLDLSSLFQPITKASLQVSCRNVDTIFRAALQTAKSGRPGPVHLSLSTERAESAVNSRPASYQRPPLFQPDGDSQQQIIELFRKAKRPTIVVGLGLEPETPYDALRRLAERAMAPVITTPKAKGALNEGHLLSAGTIGLTHDDPAYRLLNRSDCILAVGFDVVELVKPWQHAAPLIWLSRWSNEDPRLPAAAEWVGPLSPILDALADADYSPGNGWGVSAVEACIERATVACSMQPQPAGEPLGPAFVLKAIREHAPDDAIVATDVGAHKIMAALQWPCFRPNSYLVSNGLSIMGYGLPAAMAAAICRPDNVVVALIGDGGLAMSLGELRILSELKSPVIVVVFRDDALELIRSKQRKRELLAYGTTFTGPKLSQIAAAYGLSFYRPTTVRQCASFTKMAIEGGRPALMEVLVDTAGYPTAA